MKAREYKKLLAVILSAGMLTSQSVTALAAGTSPGHNLAGTAVSETAPVVEETEDKTTTEETPKEVLQAPAADGSGSMVDISEKVLKMMEEGIVYQDEKTKVLYDKATNQKVDPITGELVKETPETPETPANPETPDTPETPETPENPETPDKPVTPENPEPPMKPENPSTPENPDGNTGGTEDSKTEETKPEESKPEETIPETTPEDAKSNAALLASQKLIKVPEVKKDFRFWTVARSYSFAKQKLSIQEEMKEDARAVGTLGKSGLLYVLQEEEDGWLYVESGTVRGFVKADEVYRGNEANMLLKKYKTQAQQKAEKEQKEYTGIEGVVVLAQELVAQDQNKAFLHTYSTVNRTVVDKQYALTKVSLLNVREGKGITSRVVGTLKANNLCYVLADKDEEWIYIESGDVRGFVNKKYLSMGEEVDKKVKETGEDKFEVASQMIKPEQNKACYYTKTSVKSGVPSDKVRESIVEFAAQFIGNAYVWGGTSLTDGADCSGFVQSIYKQYGYTIPRVAENQAEYGTKIPVEDAKPGDLIFYAKNGYIYHVVMYAGDGKTIEAMNSDRGIVQANVDTTDAVWATRILDDRSYSYESSDIGEVNATEDMYGAFLGNFKLTYYCSCEICCDVETGITATGTAVVEGQTIAVDPSVILYGTQVIIGGHVFTAEDCGGAIKENRIDIYVNDHDKALALGVKQADVHLVK